MSQTPRTKKRNYRATDATLINVRALKARVAVLERDVKRLCKKVLPDGGFWLRRPKAAK